MEAKEIKKAWTVFKKEAQKELSFSLVGRCYMTAKQIKNGTATITCCNNKSYEEEIEKYKETIKKVDSYASWTDREKENNRVYCEDMMAGCIEALNKYKTKENEVKMKLAELVETNAYKKLVETIGITGTEIEFSRVDGEFGVYQIRLFY